MPKSSCCIVLFLLISIPLKAVIGADFTNQATGTSPTGAGEDQFLLGKAHAQGKGREQSWEMALHWYRKAAESGNTKAMVNLGLLYLQGQGTARDDGEGFHWIHNASTRGDARAMGLEGHLLCEGRGCKPDGSLGMTLLEKGAGLGDPFSQVMLGDQLLKSKKREGDAIVWLEKAAGAGNGHACLLLGDLFMGKKTEKDLGVASGWYEMGAWLGHPGCQFEHARLLMASNGPGSAYPWAKLAKSGGVPAANGIFWECYNFLKPEERATGDAEAERISRSLARGKGE
jgi:TPR repeat protein